LVNPQIQRRGVDQDEQPEGDDHQGERAGALDRADQQPLDRHAAEEGGRERGQQRDPQRPAAVVEAPGDEGREHRHLALGEVDDPGRAEDQDQRQRQRAVDRPVGDPVDHHLQEPFHRPPQ
jgi:hypothetical protein